MNLTPLITWSKSEFSHLPWRQNRSLYRTLVSEIMLQQTTVGTVKNHYDRFLLKFPTLQSLAKASEDELIDDEFNVVIVSVPWADGYVKK